MALRSTLHQAGAAALTQLLHQAEPPAGQREIPCGCGEKARYLARDRQRECRKHSP